jgi:hypothetical protein
MIDSKAMRPNARIECAPSTRQPAGARARGQDRSPVSHHLNRRWRTFGLFCALIPGLVGTSVATAESAPEQLDQAPASGSPWLDEVRAQRQAWENRRHETRDAYEARRRLHNPQGAVHQEAWEEDTRRQHAQRIERIERDRKHFHDLGLNQFTLPWPDNLMLPPLPFDDRGGSEFAPPGWDNLWYFRGY